MTRLMRAIDRDWLDASVTELFSEVLCEQSRNVGEHVDVLCQSPGLLFISISIIIT